MIYGLIYDRLLMRGLALAFVLWSVFFGILFCTSTFLDRLDIFIDNQATARQVAAYLLWQLPFWLWRSAPLAFLGACLTVLDNASRAGELTALESMGRSRRRIAAPLFLTGLFLGLLGFARFESQAPSFYRFARDYLNENIRKRKPEAVPLFNFVAKASEGRYFAFSELRPEEGRFSGFWLDEWNGPSRAREIFAQSGHYDRTRKAWVLNEVSERVYSVGSSDFNPQGVNISVYPQRVLEVPETPESLLPLTLYPEEMTLKEIQSRLNLLRERGLAHRNFLSEWHHRRAMNISFLLMALAAVTVVFMMPKKLFKGKLVLFGITVVIGLAYWFSLNLFKTLSTHGVFNPVWAAWAPHAAWAALAAFARLLRPVW